MIGSAAVRASLDRLRAHRVAGIWLFVGLLCLAAAERRLSEVHLNLRVAEIGFENEDVLDGDELRIRLVALNDEQLPIVSGAGPAFEPPAFVGAPSTYGRLVLGLPSPRGPPASDPAST